MQSGRDTRRAVATLILALGVLLATLGVLFVVGRGSPFRLLGWLKRGPAAEPTGSP